MGGINPEYGIHVEKNGQQTSVINLLTLGLSLQPLQESIKPCPALKLTNKNGHTTIHFASGSSSKMRAMELSFSSP
jgi:hypothetical protein